MAPASAISAISALCVIESRRAHAIRLVRAILRQPGYHFTDLSPSGNVVELNHRLGFHSLDTSTAPQINWPALRKSSVGLISDEIEIERRLSRSRPAADLSRSPSFAGCFTPPHRRQRGHVLRDWSAGSSQETAPVRVSPVRQ